MSSQQANTYSDNLQSVSHKLIRYGLECKAGRAESDNRDLLL